MLIRYLFPVFFTSTSFVYASTYILNCFVIVNIQIQCNAQTETLFASVSCGLNFDSNLIRRRHIPVSERFTLSATAIYIALKKLGMHAIAKLFSRKIHFDPIGWGLPTPCPIVVSGHSIPSAPGLNILRLC